MSGTQLGLTLGSPAAIGGISCCDGLVHEQAGMGQGDIDAILYTCSTTGSTITPGAGSLFFTGQAPGVSIGKTIAPLVGSLAITGQAPVVTRFIGPLDGLPTVTAAYSMRRLLTSYVANKAINVRRASDSAAQDFGFTAAGDLDVAALTTFLAATTGFITTWYDQSGSGLDLVQGTAANQPGVVLAETTMNNRPVMSFVAASTQNMAKATPPTLAQPFTVSAVVNHNGNFAALNTLLGGQADGNSTGYTATADQFQVFAGNSKNATATNSVAHSIVAHFNGASSKISVDQSISSATNVGAGGMTGIKIGAFFSGGRNLTALLGELPIFASALSDANILTLQANQKAYWGTP